MGVKNVNRKEIKYEVDPLTGCYNCTSHCVNKRYPLISINGKRMNMGRYIYRLYNGELSHNEVIRHTCDNTRCINPKHLIKGTQQDNIEDMISRGRVAKGEKASRTKLTEKQVSDIKLDTRTNAEIARDYGVNQSTISRIKNNKRWGHLNEIQNK